MSHAAGQARHSLSHLQTVWSGSKFTRKESKNNFKAKFQIIIKETFVEENNRKGNHSKVNQKLLLHPNHQQISNNKPSRLTSDNHTPSSHAIGKVGGANPDSNLNQQERPHDLGRYIGKSEYFATWPVYHKQKYNPKGGHWPFQV